HLGPSALQSITATVSIQSARPEWPDSNQFGRKSGEPLELPLGISVFNHDVAALDVAEVTQSLKEGLARAGVTGQVKRQVAYSSDLGRLLRLGGGRRGEEAEGEDYCERSA
ncbi:MAG: hypothetical protein ACRELS_18450, partial [Candidatus Rokuibacteriota bacterium]